MVANPSKFLGSKIYKNKITFAIENKQIKCKREVKLLGITIDENLLLRSTLLIYVAWQTKY